jgi:hypothetical protein
MKTLNIIAPIIIILCIALSGCTKKTPPTKEWNTFSCLIDGQAISASGTFNLLNEGGMYYLLQDSLILIKVITKSPRKDFYLYGRSNTANSMTFIMNKYLISGYSHLNINGGTGSGGSGYYLCNDSLPATVTINSFSGNRALGAKDGDELTGTFDIIMQNSAGQKIHLTQGQFAMNAIK